jgi:hypothetical protein
MLFFFTFCLFCGGKSDSLLFLARRGGAWVLKGDLLSEQRLEQRSPCPRRQLTPSLLVGIFHLRGGTKILGLRGGKTKKEDFLGEFIYFMKNK